MKKTLKVPAVCLLLFMSTAFFVSYVYENERIKAAGYYFGVSFCGNTTAEAKLLIDRVKCYTNLFVLQSGPRAQ